MEPRRETSGNARQIALLLWIRFRTAESGVRDEEVELVVKPVAAVGQAVRRQRIDDLSP